MGVWKCFFAEDVDLDDDDDNGSAAVLVWMMTAVSMLVAFEQSSKLIAISNILADHHFWQFLLSISDDANQQAGFGSVLFLLLFVFCYLVVIA